METEATCFIDAGDAFFMTPYIVQSKREKLEAIAGSILSSYNVMGCQLMNIGANDLAAGGDFILGLQEQADFPFISANILNAESEKAMFEPSAIIEVNGLKLGFVGVSTGDKKIKDFTFTDPVEAANQAIIKIKDKVDFVFLLANVDDHMENKLAQEVGDIDFLIRSKTGSLYRNPKEQNGVVVIRNGKQGKYAGVLKIKRFDDVSKLTNVSAQNKRIKFAENRLNAMSKGLDDGKSLEEHYAEDAKRLQLITRLREEQKTNADLIRNLKNSYYFEAIPLNEKIEDTPEVAQIVAEFMPEPKQAKIQDK